MNARNCQMYCFKTDFVILFLESKKMVVHSVPLSPSLCLINISWFCCIAYLIDKKYLWSFTKFANHKKINVLFSHLGINSMNGERILSWVVPLYGLIPIYFAVPFVFRLWNPQDHWPRTANLIVLIPEQLRLSGEKFSMMFKCLFVGKEQ